MRWKLALSYAGLLMIAGALLLSVVWMFLLRYVPEAPIDTNAGFVPNRSDLVRAFLPKATIVLAGLLVFGLVGGWMLAGMMLRPLTKITDATRRVAGGSLSHRIEMDGRSDEFRELADAFDGMLTRLEAHVSEQQRFAANASHELRTPLAITQTILDVAQHGSGEGRPEDLTRLREVNDRAIALTEALLMLSRAGNTLTQRQPADLSLFAEEAVEMLLPMAEQRGVTIEVEAAAAPTLGEPALLSQMVTNLVHNAIMHNLPVGGTITIGTGRSLHGAWLTVGNTGPVLSEAQVATFTQPFQRAGGRARDKDHVGVGLGLAIVARIVEAHQGDVRLAPAEPGGLCVRVDLPAG